MKDDSREALNEGLLISMLQRKFNVGFTTADKIKTYFSSRESSLRQEVERLKSERDTAIKEMSKQARDAGELTEKVERLWEIDRTQTQHICGYINQVAELESKIHRIVEPLKDNTQLPSVRITNAIAESEK